MFSLPALRLLHELRLRGTLTAAADALFLSRSAASHQLATLQREAGVPLTEKAGRGLRLTEAGMEVALRAERILQEIELAGAALERTRGDLVGTVQVGAFQAVAIRVLPPALADLAELHPRLRVETGSLLAEVAHVAVQSGELDVAVVPIYDGVPLPVPDVLHHELLFRDPVRLAMPAAHPLAATGEPLRISDLAGERWITGRPGTFFGQLAPRLCQQAGFAPDIVHRHADSAVLAALVAAGQGVAFIPASADLGPWPGIAVKEVESADTGRDVVAILRSSSRERPVVTAVVEAIRHRCPPLS